MRPVRLWFWVAGLLAASLVPRALGRHQRRRVRGLRHGVRAEHDVGDWEEGRWFLVVHEPDRPDWLVFFA